MLLSAVLAVVVISCKDDDKGANPKAEGVKAGTEMCDCVASYTAPDRADFVDGDGNFDETGFNQAFTEYSGNLSTCLGLLSNYQQYVTFNMEYDAEAEDPLYSVFQFKNSDFEQGFKEGTSDCMETFAKLFASMGGQ